MPQLQIYAVYNRWTGHIDLVKSKKLADRIVITYNKLFNLLKSKESVFAEEAFLFFKTHTVDKSNINFAWDITFSEKMSLLQMYFKG